MKIRLKVYSTYNSINSRNRVDFLFNKKRVLVDVDMFCQGDIVDFNDVPRDKFISRAESYLGLSNEKYKEN